TPRRGREPFLISTGGREPFSRSTGGRESFSRSIGGRESFSVLIVSVQNRSRWSFVCDRDWRDATPPPHWNRRNPTSHHQPCISTHGNLRRRRRLPDVREPADPRDAALRDADAGLRDHAEPLSPDLVARRGLTALDVHAVVDRNADAAMACGTWF